MFAITDEVLEDLRKILGILYEDNGLTLEVLLLSQAIDSIIIAKQDTIDH
ncbi:hypothetical protein [Clostridium sp.]